MTLLLFAVIVIVICVAWYLITNLLAPLRPVQVVLNVVAILVVLFLLLALFGLMDLPFKLK